MHDRIWAGLYAGVSANGTRYGWTVPGFPGEAVTCPVSDADGAARRILARRDDLAGIRGWRV